MDPIRNSPHIPQMIMQPRDKYSGESGYQLEVMKAQITFYRWGSWAFGILVITFFLYITLLFAMFVMVLLGSALLDGILNGMTRNLPRY